MERTSKFASRKKIPSRFSKNDDRVESIRRALIENEEVNAEYANDMKFSNEGLGDDNINILWTTESYPNNYFVVTDDNEIKSLLMDALSYTLDDATHLKRKLENIGLYGEDIVMEEIFDSIDQKKFWDIIYDEADEWIGELSDKEIKDVCRNLKIECDDIEDAKSALHEWFTDTYFNFESYFEDIYGDNWFEKLLDSDDSILPKILDWKEYIVNLVDGIMEGYDTELISNILFHNSTAPIGWDEKFIVFKINPTDLPDWFVDGDSSVY